MSRLIDADALLTERKKSKYYHLPNGDIAIPIIDVEHAPTVQPDHTADIGKKAEEDCISRQAAIDALHTWFRDGFDEDKWWNSTHVLAAIEGLPSAQPAPNCSEIPNGSDDTISRRAAIDALKKISFSHWFECGEYLSEDTREIEIINSNKAFEAIEALPSAQPEIIRCKDCKNYLHDEEYGFDWCNRMSGVFRAKPDGFCSWAVMRGGDSE